MAKRKGARRKPQKWEKLFYVAFTCVNLVLSVLLAALNRREILHAVQGDDEVRLLLMQKPETRTVD